MSVRLTLPQRTIGSRITGLGHYQPPTVVTNDDLVVLATCTNVFQVPGGAATVADRVGITAPGAYDINAACGQLKGQVLDRTRRQSEFKRRLEEGALHAA